MTGHTDWLDAGFHLAIIVTILFAAKLVFEFRHRFDWKGGKIGYAAFFAVLVAIGLIHAFNLLAPHLLPLYGATPENAQINPELWPDSHRHLTLFTIALIALGLTVTARGIRTLLAMAEASEQKFRDFFDNAPISMTLKDRKGRFVLINKTHEKWFGRPANEVIGKTMLEITGDSTFAGSLSKSEKFVLETNQALETSVRWNKADGQFFDWSLTKFPIRSPDGSIVSIGTFGIDVTERTQAERELAEKTAQLQSILDAAPIYISLRDAQGRYVFVNKLVSDHMGGQPENYIGKTLTELYGDTPTENLDAIAMKVLETRQPVLEREINPPGGSNTILRYSYLPVFHDNGEISGVLSIGQDVTEQLQAQAGKQASEARLSGIVDIASDAIIMVDKDHCVATFNKGAEQIFGYAAAELIGRPLDMLIPEAFRAAHGDQITTFERSSRISRPMAARGEIAGLRKDGSTFPAEASISKLQLGEETVFAVFLCDITDRKRQEKAIRDSEKSLRAILEYSPIGVAIVSHDWVDGHVEAKRLFANDALVEMFGGSSARQMVDDDIVATWIDPDQFHAVNENMKNHVDLVDFEVRRRRIDGRNCGFRLTRARSDSTARTIPWCGISTSPNANGRPMR